MRTAAILILTVGLVAGAARAEEAQLPETAPAAESKSQVDPATVRTKMQQRRAAWRQLTPEQRRLRLQAARTQTQTLHNQNTQ